DGIRDRNVTGVQTCALPIFSVPVWPVTLSGRLPITALVGHYPTNKLIGREPIKSQNKSFHHEPCDPQSYPVLDIVSNAYPEAKEIGRASCRERVEISGVARG